MDLPRTAAGDVVPLAVVRVAAALTCADVGDVCGACAADVAAWERGAGEPSGAQWAALALRFGVPVTWLRGGALPYGEAWDVAVAYRNGVVRGLLRR
jgi:hypothetical protein